MKKILIATAMTAMLVSCSSTKKEPETKDVDQSKTFQKDFVVRDASSAIRPGWIENANLYAKEHGYDLDKSTYYSFETEPKVSREAACKLADANVKSDIASEIVTFINREFGNSKEGNAAIDPNNPQTQALREFMSDTLVEKTQTLISGAQIKVRFWEKRDYQVKLGAKKDYIGFTCGVLVQMDNKILQNAINEATNKIVAKADDAATKENVKKALEKADENYLKARKGEL